jgi:hypothetical protein
MSIISTNPQVPCGVLAILPKPTVHYSALHTNTLRRKAYPAFQKNLGVLEGHIFQPLGVLQGFFRLPKLLKVLANLIDASAA